MQKVNSEADRNSSVQKGAGRADAEPEAKTAEARTAPGGNYGRKADGISSAGKGLVGRKRNWNKNSKSSYSPQRKLWPQSRQNFLCRKGAVRTDAKLG